MLERGVFNLGFLLKRTSPQSLPGNSEPEQPVKATEDIVQATSNKQLQDVDISSRPRAISEITIDTIDTIDTDSIFILRDIEQAKGILKEERSRQTGLRIWRPWCCRCKMTVTLDSQQRCTEKNCKHQRCDNCKMYGKPEGETLQKTNLSPVQATSSVI